jgi:hypothetical protein
MPTWGDEDSDSPPIQTIDGQLRKNKFQRIIYFKSKRMVSFDRAEKELILFLF